MRTILSIAALCLLCSCSSTVTPKVIYSDQASWDGSAQNSGIIAETPDHYFIVTPHFRDRYNTMISAYSGRFDPALKAGDGLTGPTSTNTFLMDAQHMGYFEKMNGWRKAAAPP